MNSTTKAAILFVDDEANVLEGLRRSMRSMRHDWDMRFASSGVDALTQLADYPADVVVTDMRMPGMDGAQLLQRVKHLYPGAIRFVLSGNAEPTSVMQATATAHQYLSKPCDSTILKSAIQRAQRLKRILGNDALASWAGEAEALPALPEPYRQIVACVQDPASSVGDIAKLIEADFAMSATVLKLANSAYFGAGQQVRTTERAVSFLGIDNVAALVLTKGVFTAPTVRQTEHVDIARLWQHSLSVASLARLFAVHEKLSPVRADDAFLAGMLHDLGRVVIATSPAALDPAPDIDHGLVGAYVVGLWGFPDVIVEAIAFHHSPSKATDSRVTLFGLLHAANMIVSGDDSGFDQDYFAGPGMMERWRDWQALASERSVDPGAAA